MNVVASNDLKKGARLRLKNGWMATVADNMKGNIRMCDVEGLYREIGSTYVWDWDVYIDAAGVEYRIALTDKQRKAKATVNAMGF